MSAGVSVDELPAKVAQRTGSVAVVGQGYVGLTLASAAAAQGFRVSGIDSNADRTDALSRGELAVPGVDETTFRAAIDSGNISFSSSPDPVAGASFIFICVPTPLRDGAPDLSYVEAAGRDVASAPTAPGSLVVLESTTYPGTTDRAPPAAPRARLGARARGTTSCSRIRRSGSIRAAPSSRCETRREWSAAPHRPPRDAALAFYGQLVDKVFPVSSTRTAETANSGEHVPPHQRRPRERAAMLTHDLDIDVWEVIEAAATKPFGFMPFYPGPGIGGHCIPLDPTYLSWQVRRQTGRRFGVLEAAQDVNERMPNYVASRVAGILNDVGRAVRGSRIFVLGVTYKADVGDMRESPSLMAMQALYRKGAEVSFHDPFVEEAPLNGGDDPADRAG